MSTASVQTAAATAGAASLGRLARREARALPLQSRARRTLDSGVNLITYGALSNGVGEASRLVAVLLQEAGVSSETYAHDLSVAPARRHPRLFDTTIAALNATDHLIAAAVFPRLFSPRRHRIGVWHWEVDAAPLKYRLAGAVTDEIWTTSAYQQELMGAIYRRPVHVLPLPVPSDEPDAAMVVAVRERIGARDRFVFGFQFDWNSSRRRKNPDGVLQAYLRAFPEQAGGTLLFIKTINGEQHPDAVRDFLRGAEGRTDVVMVDEFWPSGLNASLSHALDCYVTLHRAEGFGLTIAKAMAAGKAVIATGYSGNLDFMPEGTALLVPWTLTRVGQDPIYPATAHWAEPDLDAAADFMRAVYEDAALREELGARARAHILRTRSEESSVAWVGERLGVVHS